MDRLKIGLAAAIALTTLVGCGSKKDEVDVAAFKGGYGIDFYEKAASEFNAKHPGVPVHVWGNPRIWSNSAPDSPRAHRPISRFRVGTWATGPWFTAAS